MYIKYFYRSVIGILCFMSVSCAHNILDVDPYAVRTYDQYYSNSSELLEGLNLCYGTVQSLDFEISLFDFGNIASDDSEKGGSSINDRRAAQELSEFRPLTDNSCCRVLWTQCFKGIYYCNIIIANQEKGADNPELTARITKEAKFLRAYFYYFLLTTFGDVPWIDKPLNSVELNVARMPANEVWNFVENDFIEATALPKKSEYPSAEMGRVTSGAAYGMLAKSYMFQQKYQDAEKALSQVVHSSEYALEEDFGAIFRKSGENGVESVFEIQHFASKGGWGDDTEGTVLNIHCTNRNSGGWGFDCPTEDLKQEFEPGDPRIIYTLVFDGDVFDGAPEDNSASPTFYHNYKVYLRYDERDWNSGSDQPYNIRHLRYADLILLYAEALNENGKPSEALTYLNMVRDRARNTPAIDPRRTHLNYDLSYNGEILPKVTTTNPTELRNKIWHERRVELAMEYHRRVDLIRQGRLGDIMLQYAAKWNSPKGLNFQKGKHEVMPVPLSEIERTNGSLSQNPGY